MGSKPNISLQNSGKINQNRKDKDRKDQERFSEISFSTTEMLQQIASDYILSSLQNQTVSPSLNFPACKISTFPKS
jgi:hypothetical protein